MNVVRPDFLDIRSSAAFRHLLDKIKGERKWYQRTTCRKYPRKSPNSVYFVKKIWRGVTRVPYV